MKILIGSPAFGGMVTASYLKSYLAMIGHLQADGHHVDLHMEESESLIPRGRNTCATYALQNGYDKLLFIDTDMVFTIENVRRLLKSDKMVVGGSYPLKAHPIVVNFNPLDEHRDLFGDKRQQDNYFEWVKKYADENGEAEVMHIPTGFMLIDIRVLAKLTYRVRWYRTFHPEFGIKNQFYEFFPSGVTSNNEYESEDWAFCRLAREEGFKIYLQTQAINGHVGTMRYGMGQHIIIGQPPLIPSGEKK